MPVSARSSGKAAYGSVMHAIWKRVSAGAGAAAASAAEARNSRRRDHFSSFTATLR